MWNDLRFAVRSLLKRPGFLLTAVITCGLGIGAAATLFSVVDGVLMRPLPYRAAARIAILWHEFGQGAQNLPAVHPLDVRDYNERNKVFEEMTIARGAQDILGDATDPEAVDVGQVAANFFPFFGVEPILGRSFRAADDVPGGPKVLMLTHRVWVRRYAGDPGVIGRAVPLFGEPHEIIGVLPEDFRMFLPAEAFGLRDADVWRPMQIDYTRLPPRNYTAYTAFGRLRPGATFAAAQDDLSNIAAQIRAEQPVHKASQLKVRVVPFQQDVVKGAEQPLLLLLAAVALVLIIACANVALLLLTRGHGRTREMLVRVSVGAGRFSLARLVLAEAVTIGLLGALLGIVIADRGLALVKALAADSVPRLGTATIDLGAVGFAVAASLVAACVFAAAPALRASGIQIATGLRAGAYAGGAHRRLHDVLAAGQIALSLVLIVGAGLLVRSFAAMASARPGFEPDGAISMEVTVPRGTYTDRAGADAFNQNLITRLHALPSVGAVGQTSLLPFTGRGPAQPYAYNAETASNWESVSADELRVSPGYLEALGATLLAGRDFTADDRGERRVLMIDDSLARRAFGSEAAAVGKALQIEPEGKPESFFEVVGVVGHTRLHDITRPLLPQIYFPGLWPRFTLVARPRSGDTQALAADLRRELAAINPGIAVGEVRPLRSVVGAASGPTRLAMGLMIAFGGISLVLAAVGIYGVFAFAMGQRTYEIAVRLAMGAQRGAIRRLVLGGAARIVAGSIAVGAVAAAALSWSARSMLYAVAPLDIATYALAASFLGAVALLACAVPAERAARVDPQRALRQS